MATGLRGKAYQYFNHAKSQRQDSRWASVVRGFGAKGYGVAMMICEKLMESPVLKLEFCFADHELLDIGLAANDGDKAFFRELMFYCRKQGIFNYVSHDELVYDISGTWLSEALQSRISATRRAAVSNERRSIEAEKKLQKARKTRKTKLMLADEENMLAKRVKRMQSYLDFGDARIEALEMKWKTIDIRQALNFFRNTYVVDAMNVEMYINTIQNKETGEEAFTAFMVATQLTTSASRSSGDSPAQVDTNKILKEFKI